MSERFVRRTGHVPAPDRQHAARHVLAQSRLRLALEDFWDEERGGPDWAQMMAVHGREAADAILIALAESLWSGPLGAVGRLGDGDRDVLRQAMELVAADAQHDA